MDAPIIAITIKTQPIIFFVFIFIINYAMCQLYKNKIKNHFSIIYFMFFFNKINNQNFMFI